MAVCQGTPLYSLQTQHPRTAPVLLGASLGPGTLRPSACLCGKPQTTSHCRESSADLLGVLVPPAPPPAPPSLGIFAAPLPQPPDSCPCFEREALSSGRPFSAMSQASLATQPL